MDPSRLEPISIDQGRGNYFNGCIYFRVRLRGPKDTGMGGEGIVQYSLTT